MMRSLINRALAPIASALVFSGLVQCHGQGTMQFRFEGQPRGTVAPIGIYIESGMRFWNPYGPNNLTLAGGGVSDRPENGTGYLQVTPGAKLGFGFYTFPGTPFNLLSFDAAEYITGSLGPVSLLVVGYQGMGLTVTNAFTTDGVNDGTGPLNDFEALHLGPEFVELYHVDVFSQNGSPLTQGFSVDNVLISGVPEPSTGTLVLLGAACAFGRSRIKRRRP
jgi:hypothetical protein